MSEYKYLNLLSPEDTLFHIRMGHPDYNPRYYAYRLSDELKQIINLSMQHYLSTGEICEGRFGWFLKNINEPR